MSRAESEAGVKSVSEYVNERDFSGAIALIEHQMRVKGQSEPVGDLWLAFCHTHLRHFQDAIQVYKRLLLVAPFVTSTPVVQKVEKKNEKKKSLLSSVFGQSSKREETTQKELPLKTRVWSKKWLMLCIAVSLFSQSLDDESEDVIRDMDQEPDSEHESQDPDFQSLRKRLKHLLSLRLYKDPGQETEWNSQSLSDDMCVAATHCERHEFQSAILVYHKSLERQAELLALNYFMGVCYYRLEDYSVAHSLFSLYLKSQDESLFATNARLAVDFCTKSRPAEETTRLFASLDPAVDPDVGLLIRHNVSVSRLTVSPDCDSSLRTLSQLREKVREAKANIAISHLRRGEDSLAFEVFRPEFEEKKQNNRHNFRSTHEATVCAVVHAIVGQKTDNDSQLKYAQSLFQSIGSSASECDTIPGRESMSCAFFLAGDMTHVLLYLSSISSYFSDPNDGKSQAFDWNYGVAKAGVGQWTQACESLLRVRSQGVRSRSFCCCLTRSLVRSQRPDDAWHLILDSLSDSEFVDDVLTMFANDCFVSGFFLHALRAFDRLVDSSHESWESIRASVAGHMQAVVAGRQSLHTLTQVLLILNRYSQPDALFISDVIRKYIKQQDDKI